jgi:hypothetical protein
VAIDNYVGLFRATKGQAINGEPATPGIGIRPFQSALPPHEMARINRLPYGSLEDLATEALRERFAHLAGTATPRTRLVGV